MRLADLVSRVYAAFDVRAALADVETLCEYDRYQASAGIHQAAEYVADRARAAGLSDVDILRLPADGGRHWWTFRAPPEWTPAHAELRVGDRAVLRYPEQPYALAAYSNPTAVRDARLVTWSAVDRGADPAGAVVVVDHPGIAVSTVLERVAGRGPVAVVTDPIATRPGREPGQRGRIELAPGATLAAFSATAEELAELARAAVRGATAHVVVRTATGSQPRPWLPVVTGRVPQTGGHGDTGELLLSAHLCHPRPSANDNASGVAALLGVAHLAAQRASTPGPALRFVWGPEFVGLAGYLHDHVGTGRVPTPVAAVNIDMAGEDQRRCGGPLIVERVPDELPSYLSAVTERCVALLPQAARSYTGAVATDTWAWRATPYSGGSDHSLLVAPPTRCPTVGLGHWPDRANHTSADTLDKVDPAELRRTATVAGATLLAVRAAHVRSDHTADLRGDLVATTTSWAADLVLGALPSAGPAERQSRVGGQPVLDGWAEEQAGRLLDHRTTVALGAVDSLTGLGVDAATATRAIGWVRELARLARARLPSTRTPEPAAGRDDATVLTPLVDGPPNLRGLAERVPDVDRSWISERLARDRGGSYARMLALLRGVDGHRDRRTLTWWATLASGLPMALSFADDFLDIACRSGWIGPIEPASGNGD